MLGNEEGNTALTDTLLVLRHHVVTHDLHIAAVGLLKELSYEVCFRIECDAMMHQRMLLEERFQDIVIRLVLFIQRQVYLKNLDVREVES